MSTPLLPRASGQLIAAGAKHVTIDEAGVKKCAEFIFGRKAEGKLSVEDLFHKTPVHPKVADESGVNWVFFADTLNFAFWNLDSEPHYEVTYKDEKYTGYLALCAAISRTLDEGVPLTDPNFFGFLTAEELDQHLMGDDGIHCPLIDVRLNCLKEVYWVLKEKYGGSVSQLIAKAEKNAQKLLFLLTSDFPCFQDRAEFLGVQVSIYKRAQILIADLWALFRGEGLGEFGDIGSLTMFADYRVPQSLQYFGVFKYSQELMTALKSDTLLQNGSEFEVEIRGCSIAAVERIVEEIKKRDSVAAKAADVNNILVDYFLWCFRREKAEEMKQFPFHKARSMFY